MDLLLELKNHHHPVIRLFDQIERRENRHMTVDEALIQCLLGDPAVFNISTESLRYIDRESAKNCHPNTLTMGHREAIRATRALFAREFDPENSAKPLDRADDFIGLKRPATGNPTGSTPAHCHVDTDATAHVQPAGKQRTLKFGFVILSHHPPDSLFLKLLEYLAAIPNARIAIHHDESQSHFPKEIVERYGVHLVQPSRATRWGHATKVPATLDAFRLLHRIDPNIDWYLTVSPNCYPLVTIERFVEFHLEATADAMIDMHRVHRQADEWLKVKYRFLFSRYLCHVPWISRNFKPYLRAIRYPIPRKTTPFAALDPWQGSDWFTLSRRMVLRMLQARLEDGPVLQYLAMINETRHTHVSPIEMVIPTFVAQQGDLEIIYDNFRFIDWENAKNWHPNTLTMRHWEAIQASNALFARKFDPLESRELLDRIGSAIG